MISVVFKTFWIYSVLYYKCVKICILSLSIKCLPVVTLIFVGLYLTKQFLIVGPYTLVLRCYAF